MKMLDILILDLDYLKIPLSELILCCLLDSKSFDTLLKYFLRFWLADLSNGLALFYYSCFQKTYMILSQKYQHLLHY